jgi:hypothetical protein
LDGGCESAAVVFQEICARPYSAFVIIAALRGALISRAVVARIPTTDSGSADNAIHSA